MAKRKNKKSKKRLMIFGTLSLVAIIYFAFNLCYYSYKIAVLEKSKKELEQELVTLQNKETQLNDNIQKLKDPEYIAKYARENYMYSKDGEYIIKIEQEQTKEEQEEQTIDYKYLIIICICILILIIFYITKKTKKKGSK